MPKKPPPVWPKGSRPPNSGRKPGVPNKVSVAVRELIEQLMTNPDYQRRLREDWRRRRVHPTIEALIWAYHLGKPKQIVDLTAAVNVNALIEEERQAFALLEVRDMEALAEQSQQLVDRALALARSRIAAASIDHPAVVESDPSRKST